MLDQATSCRSTASDRRGRLMGGGDGRGELSDGLLELLLLPPAPALLRRPVERLLVHRRDTPRCKPNKRLLLARSQTAVVSAGKQRFGSYLAAERVSHPPARAGSRAGTGTDTRLGTMARQCHSEREPDPAVAAEGTRTLVHLRDKVGSEAVHDHVGVILRSEDHLAAEEQQRN